MMDSNAYSCDDSQYSFRLFHFQEIKCCTGEKRPEPRSAHRIVHYKGRIYSFGGFNPDFGVNFEEWLENEHPFKEVWELNLTTGRWTKCEMKGVIPKKIVGHTAVCHPLHPGMMLIYGGAPAPLWWTTDYQCTINTVVSCHLETREFKRLVTKEGKGQPMALHGHAVVTDNSGLFYTVGGTNFSYHHFMDVNMLDLRSSPPVWTSLYRLSGVMDEPGPRYSNCEVSNFRATLNFPLTITNQVL